MLRKFAMRWWRPTVCILFCLVFVGTTWAQGWIGNAPDVSWVSPSAVTAQSTGLVPGTDQTEDNHNLNFNCSPETYRLQFDLTGTMHTGCFATTAFGAFDIAGNVVRGYNFPDAIPFRAFGNQQIVPIPGYAGLATTSGTGSIGSYLHIYTYVPSQVQLQYDWLLHPYLQLPAAANMVLSDPVGQPIIINAQTIAYSNNGSWMVVESPWRSFFRVNMATFDITPFAPSFTTLAFDTTQHSSHVAITDDGRYAAIQSDEFGSFKVYDLKNCSGTVASDLKPLNCPSHNYSQAVATQIPGWHITRHLRFVSDSLLNFHATGTGDANNYLLSPGASITNLTDYLALGDSYSAGEGAFNYLAGTDDPNNKCHQSTKSYPYLLTHDLFNGGHSVACSGAVIDDMISRDPLYRGQVRDGVMRKDRTNVDDILADFTPGYVAQYEFAAKYQPRVLTVGVGGNDIGFADIIATCVSPVKEMWPGLFIDPNTCYGTYEERQELLDRINGTYENWLGLYNQLRNMAPNTRIYAIGYPQIVAANGNCAVNVHLTEAEIKFSQGLVDYLNSVIKKAAADAGVNYVDIGHALDGHRLCEATGASVAVNGLTAGNDNLFLGNESYHPNALGQELIEQAILHGTHNFSDPVNSGSTTTPTPPTTSSDDPLLQAPKSGRKINTLVPDSSITDSRATRGSTLHLRINGLKDGVQPNSTYIVHLRGDDTDIGTVNSNENGDVDGSVEIPPGSSSGNQIVDISGPGITGEPIDVNVPIFIGHSPTDSDGDGILDQQDSCPYYANSGQDVDQDGIDDACDGNIGAPPVITSGGSNNSSGSSSDTHSNSSSDSASNSVYYADMRLQVTAAPSKLTILASAANAVNPAAETVSVLGTSTIAQPSSSLAPYKPAVSVFPRDNLPNIYWLPWAIDALLIPVLLICLNWLFRRTSD